MTPRAEFALAAVERNTSALIGFGRLTTDPHQQHGANIGFALRPGVWGVGYGLETVGFCSPSASTTSALHRIRGARAPRSEASAKTTAAAGMVKEGTIREHVLKAGQWRDSVLHAVLDREWAALSRAAQPSRPL
ncbi:GNAT family N-acetyltransferase (plasmid) [Streptomyces jietaisiensis]